MGPRRSEYSEALKRQGVSTESWLLQKTPQGDMVVVYFEADELEKAFAIQAKSKNIFDVWFKQQEVGDRGRLSLLPSPVGDSPRLAKHLHSRTRLLAHPAFKVAQHKDVWGLEAMRVKRGDCVLVVVDVQDRLIDTIAEHESMVQNIQALLKAAAALKVPILATEQENLGDTVPELKALIPDPPTRKLTFGSCDSLEFMTKLNATRKKTVVICGIETHICVTQTVLDLIPGHCRILVVKDATSSHAVNDREVAIRRMEASGAETTTTEAIIYEMTEKAGTDEFKKILDIVKERRAHIPAGEGAPTKHQPKSLRGRLKDKIKIQGLEEEIKQIRKQ